MKQYNIIKFFKGFRYAINGIFYCIINERNIRFDLVVMAFILIFKKFYSLSSVENIILYLTFAIVLSAEAFNTAIEAFVDLVSPKYNKLAKIAKDVSAGAVLVNAIFSFVIGIYLFWDIAVFKNIFSSFRENKLFSILIIILIIISFIFVFGIKDKKNKNKDVNNGN